MTSGRHVRLVSALGVLGLGACSGSDTTGPSQGHQMVNLSIATQSGSASAAGAPATETLTMGGHTLVIVKVELVLKKLELERVNASGECVTDDSSGASASDDEGQGHHERPEAKPEECASFETGPMLVDLPLGSGPQRVLSVQVDTGHYQKLEFKIHTPDADADDSTLLQQHPDIRRLSIRVRGTFDSLPFGFVSKLSVKEELDLTTPLVVTASTATDLTIMIDLSKWFLDATGTTLIDPLTAIPGQPNEFLVRHNIRSSFHAFQDQDQDGHDDHDH